jgi:hypothetical protein
VKIKTEDLRAAFNLIRHVPEVGVLESSRFVRCSVIENKMELHLASTLLGFAEIKIKEGGRLRFHLDRNALNCFLKAASADDIDLRTGDKLLLQQGRNRLEVANSSTAIAGYGTRPQGPTTQNLEFTPEEYSKLQVLLKYIPTKAVDERYSAIQGVKGFGWIAGDGLVLTAWRVKNLADSMSLPSALWRAMGQEDEFLEYGKLSVCRTKNGVLIQSLHADLATFPVDKARQVAESAFETKPVVEVETDAWLKALCYLESFASEGAYVDCECGKGQLLLRLSATGLKAETTMPAKVAGSPKNERWDFRKLLPWSNSTASKVIRIATMENRTAFTTETKRDLLVLVSMSQ